MEQLAEFPEKLSFLFEPWRYKIAHGGRGGAKSWNFARALLVLGSQKKLRILCARETMESIAQSVHQTLRDQIERLKLQSVYDVEKSSIVGRNGTLFTFAGLAHNITNIKSLEAYDIVWVEEAQTVSDLSWDTLIPTIRKDGSEIWITFNAKLETDATYQRFVINPPATAKVVLINWRDNFWFPEVLRVEMEDLRERDYAKYLHIYEGDCASSVEGAIFAAEMRKATDEGRIGNVPYNRAKPVDTVWDLGFGDLTCIWFAQNYDGWFNFIDYEEDAGQTIEHYMIVMQNKGYLYGTDWLPHDGVDSIIHQKLAGNREMSVEMLMREAGRKVRIVQKVHVGDRINAARTIFPQCRFDKEKCKDGLQALRYYQWGPLDKLGMTKRLPLHNAASHASDAFTMAGMALRQPKKEEKRKDKTPPYPRSASPIYAPFG